MASSGASPAPSTALSSASRPPPHRSKGCLLHATSAFHDPLRRLTPSAISGAPPAPSSALSGASRPPPHRSKGCLLHATGTFHDPLRCLTPSAISGAPPAPSSALSGAFHDPLRRLTPSAISGAPPAPSSALSGASPSSPLRSKGHLFHASTTTSRSSSATFPLSSPNLQRSPRQGEGLDCGFTSKASSSRPSPAMLIMLSIYL